jgi:hypothetical protein
MTWSYSCQHRSHYSLVFNGKSRLQGRVDTFLYKFISRHKYICMCTRMVVHIYNPSTWETEVGGL